MNHLHSSLAPAPPRRTSARYARVAALLLAALLGASPTARADAPAAPPGQSPAPLPVSAERLTAVIDRASTGDFWGAVLVAKDGEPVLMRGFGPRLRPGRAPTPGNAPIDERTFFDVGSVTKPLVALAVLALERDGRLSIDDPIEQHLPPEAAPPKPSGVTIRHLLTHTSGRDPAAGIRPYNEPSPVAAARAFFEGRAVSDPGQAWSYHNGAYCVLALIVERAAGEPFEAAMRRLVFIPMNMTDAGFPPDEHIDRQRCSSRAEGATAADHPWGWGARGCTGALTTLADWLAFDRAARAGAVLGPDGWTRLHTPVIDARAGHQMALGWFVAPSPAGTPRVFHTGGTRGYSAVVARYPVEGWLIVVMTSQGGNIRGLLEGLERAVFNADGPGFAVKLFFPGVSLNEHDLGLIEGAASWRIARGAVDGPLAAAADAARLELVRAADGAVLARLDLARPTAARLARELAEALPRADAAHLSRPTIISLMHRWNRQGGHEGLGLPGEPIMLAIEPVYRGEQDDRRPMLVVRDRGSWPLIVRMDAAAAESLARALDAAGRPARP